ncbi:hypothetical protein CC86DRAFT_400261 [Ophiobolus disseminans]|uniref:Uncharacterized protein n=1 Tax=Ophiobolus disseminans TaxID=1469910 RepID=A0A6A7AM98_9PLEO|nr:hypothetical protein CC86DRAFT_400261 [Ophiobolus disseminans]
MPLLFPDGELLGHLLQLCRNHLFDNRQRLNFNGKNIEYVPNDIIDDVETLHNISNIVDSEETIHANPWQKTRSECAQAIFHNGKKLFATTIRARTNPPVELVLNMMVDHRITDAHLPLPTGVEPVSPEIARELKYDFRPVQLELSAPIFVYGTLEQYAPSVSNIPFVSAHQTARQTNETVFDVMIHSSHVSGDLIAAITH